MINASSESELRSAEAGDECCSSARPSRRGLMGAGVALMAGAGIQLPSGAAEAASSTATLDQLKRAQRDPRHRTLLKGGMVGNASRRLGVTRRALFEELDRPNLNSLPAEPYCFAEWRVRRAGGRWIRTIDTPREKPASSPVGTRSPETASGRLSSSTPGTGILQTHRWEGNGFEISVPRRLSPPPTSWVAFISAVSCGT